MVTKSMELDILRRTIQELGPDSYCGPWLESVLSEIEHDIRSDFPPVPTVTAYRAAEARVIEMAKGEAGRIVFSAKEEAERIRGAAVDFAENLRNRLYRDLNTALARISD